MDDQFNLQRFVEAQEDMFGIALGELEAGRKQSHWMWFIFPQLKELGQSATAKYFGIASIDEASAFLAHPLLSSRLKDCVQTLRAWAGRRSAAEILGPLNSIKLLSSLTLFGVVDPHSIFECARGEFFAGEQDERTLALLKRGQ